LLVNARCGVIHANTAGRARLAESGRGIMEEVRAAIASSSPSPRFRVVRVASGGEAERFLVVERTSDALSARVSAAATRWSLTPREREILWWVARGKANRTIAAALRVAERTVEAHVTSLLEKACVESRSALVASIWEV
jgi:DNA-binding NarL/FixJ family response regulator